MKIASGDWKWIEDIDVGEQVNVEIKQIKKTSDGKRNYIHAIDEDTGNFFMANISPQQALELEGIKYALMTCCGHSDKKGKAVFYYDFDVSCGKDSSKEKGNGNPFERGDNTSPGRRYTTHDLEEELMEVLHHAQKNFSPSHYEYQWTSAVEEYLIKAVLVLHRSRITRIILTEEE